MVLGARYRPTTIQPRPATLGSPPLIMEWKTRQWPNHNRLTVAHDLIENMSAKDVVMFDTEELPPVFTNVDEAKFQSVSKAIESRVSLYGEADDDTQNDDDVPDF